MLLEALARVVMPQGLVGRKLIGGALPAKTSALFDRWGWVKIGPVFLCLRACRHQNVGVTMRGKNPHDRSVDLPPQATYH